MDIVAYLLELIETRKIVGINALGTLYKKKIPGRYDSDTHSFLPPKYEIAFTTEIKEDQELVNFISEKRGISIESANYYITEFVENIHAQLSDHQQANFSPLGELKLINDQIVFESSKVMEIGFDFYGLPSVTNHQKQSQQEEDTVEKVPAFEKGPDTEIEVNTIPITDPLWKPTVISRYEYDEEEDDDENKGRGVRIFLKITLVLLIFAAVVSVAVYFLFPDLYYNVKESFSRQQIEDKSTGILDTSSNQKIDSPVIDTTVLPIITVKDSLTNVTVTQNKTINYEVIGSAMKTEKKVSEFISKLAKRGIAAKKMESLPGRLIKISLGTFTDYNLAKKFQDSLKIKLRNPDIYIQTIKPKN